MRELRVAKDRDFICNFKHNKEHSEQAEGGKQKKKVHCGRW